MPFDWINFLTNHNIHYETKGPNLGRGWIGLPCPFCGDDPSFHLGISLKHGGWNCWRGVDHKGRQPHRLIMALIGCTAERANQIVGSAAKPSFNVLGDLSGRINIDAIFNKGKPVAEPKNEHLDFLNEFRPIDFSFMANVFAVPYLHDRGYKNEDIVRLVKRHNLKFAMEGPYAYRIVFPIYLFGDLVTWTGRTVIAQKNPRYKTLTTDYGKSLETGLPQAVESIKDCLFDFDFLCSCQEGGTLVLTEGPFDAVRVTHFGEMRQVYGTCIFGIGITDAQLNLLARLSLRFKHLVLLADQGALSRTLATLPDWLGFKPRMLPKSVKDPGEMSAEVFDKIFAKV